MMHVRLMATMVTAATLDCVGAKHAALAGCSGCHHGLRVRMSSRAAGVDVITGCGCHSVVQDGIALRDVTCHETSINMYAQMH